MNRAMYPGQHGLDVLERVREGEITLPRTVDPNVPPELDKIVRRATSFDAEERYQTARSLAGALAQFLHLQDELIDAESVERFIAHVAPREVTSPKDGDAELTSSTAATIASVVAGGRGDQRERRHVVVVAGVVRSVEQAADDGVEHSVAGIGDEAARVLGDIAYKTGAVLSWPEGAGRHRFRFIVGLGKPSVQDPLTAIRLAMDVIEALQGLSADALIPLTASLGVSRGVVSTVRDGGGRLLRYEPVGRVVEVAEQLAEAGDAGEVLGAGEVYRLVRRTYTFDENAVREVNVTTEHGTAGGRRDTRSIRAYPLRGKRTREERAADAEADAGAEGVVGRLEEMRAIEAAYQEAQASRRGVFIALVGELGAGKSALVAGALATLEPRPRLLRVECAFGNSEVPFATAADLVREVVGIPDDSSAERARTLLHEFVAARLPTPKEAGARASLLEGLEPLVAPVARERGAERDGDRAKVIWRAVQDLLQIVGGEEPLLVWIDSLQWADTPSLELLRALLRRTFRQPVLVLFSTRPEPRAEGVLASIPRIELGDLDDEARRELVRARLGNAQVPAEVEQAIVDRAGGNPFFLVEVVEALIERGVIAVETGEDGERRVVRRPGVAMSLPTTLEGIIAARLGKLPRGATAHPPLARRCRRGAAGRRPLSGRR